MDLYSKQRSRIERKIKMSLMDFGARLIPLQKGGKRPARKLLKMKLITLSVMDIMLAC